MRTGSCKFGANCRFNHPDPTMVGGSTPPSTYANGRAVPLQGVSQPSMPSWSASGALNETGPFVPMMIPPVQGVSPQSSDWNGYQVIHCCQPCILVLSIVMHRGKYGPFISCLQG